MYNLPTPHKLKNIFSEEYHLSRFPREKTDRFDICHSFLEEEKKQFPKEKEFSMKIQCIICGTDIIGYLRFLQYKLSKERKKSKPVINALECEKAAKNSTFLLI